MRVAAFAVLLAACGGARAESAPPAHVNASTASAAQDREPLADDAPTESPTFEQIAGTPPFTIDQLQERFAPYEGQRVRWPLRAAGLMFGAHITTPPEPPGVPPEPDRPVQGAYLFISRRLAAEDRYAVAIAAERGEGVIACRPGSSEWPQRGNVVVEGTVWEAIEVHSILEVWLRDCAVTAEP